MTDFEKLCEYADHLTIIDTHEHMTAREPENWDGIEVVNGLLLPNYNHTTLGSAGLKYDWVSPRPVAEKWKAIEPFWEDCRYTGYMQCAQITVKDLLGVDEISGKTIEDINERFLQTLRPGIYKEILQDKCRIAVSIVDCDDNCDRRFFRTVFHIDAYVMPAIEKDLWEVEANTGIKIRCLDDWMEAFETDLRKRMENGAVALKCALAYQRPIHFARPSYSDAQRDFNQMYAHRYTASHIALKHGAGQAFQDYMMHHICRVTERAGLPMQVHTGLLEGITNHLDHADPRLLNNLFVEYPDLNFDLFHISYPCQHAAGALAKMFPNVYVDMCWAHIISPEASVRTLDEWIGLLPLNKISAFGGDFNGSVPHLVYGHAKMARRNVCRVLDKKIQQGLMDFDEACAVAQKLFYGNPASLFRLG